MSPLWISEAAFRDLIEEANRAYPLETGGVLVGYFAQAGDSVVFAALGPGPNAVHRRNRFEPDHDWQCDQLDALFEQSSGTWVYLGDWHTHPDGSPRMSWRDQQTLRSIARHQPAEAPYPVMLIGGGSFLEWNWAAYQYQRERLLGAMAQCKACNLRLFPIC